MKYIDVILPLPLDSTFTYSVPDEWGRKITIGMRVVVPFGKRKMYTGIVTLIHSNPPEHYETKEIIYLLDEKPILRHPQLKLWKWIAAYYQSALGEVYQAALPAGLKIESETLVRINTDFEGDIKLTPGEQRLIDLLADAKIHKVSELSSLAGVKSALPLLKSLMEKGLVEISEELHERYRPKMLSYVRMAVDATNQATMHSVFDELSRAPRQLDLLMKMLDLSKALSGKAREVSKKELLVTSGVSEGILKSLADRGVLEIYRKEVGRLDRSKLKTEALSVLNEFQEQALKEVYDQFTKKSTVLLHGVTSSGKTEIYIHLIEEMLKQKKQVLYLVPEIALTTQLTSRLKRIFGNKLAVYHSRFSDAERVEIWNSLLNDKGYEIVIGARSSLFVPFRQLGLVIVDEEHESSFKQYDPAPRYNARNAAIVLAQMHGAKTLLGSATPAIESYYNAQTGKFGLVEMKQRYRELELPDVLTANTREAYRKKEMEGHFTPLLLEKMKRALSRSEQVILFQNRRGYSPMLECKACAHVPKCRNCDVSLTVHRFLNKLTCHYCGYTENIPEVCPVCKTPGLENKGFGTEMIEEELAELIPEARVSRMDLDTTRRKKSYEKIISDFENGKIDILVGTQMVTKGLDFERVSLVGVLNADNMLNFPDFRSHERAYQLMAQVSGRAGRKNKRGTVVLQTSNPEHPVIRQVMHNDYVGMFKTQTKERELFRYPPFFRLIEITLRHRDYKVTDKAAEELAQQMRTYFGSRVYGPNIPMVSRVQNYYIKNILLKIEVNAPVDKAKEVLQTMTNSLLAQSPFKSLRISLDVDPM